MIHELDQTPGKRTPKNPARRCTARKIGTMQRCPNVAIRGGTVCPRHGGQAPAVRAKAQARLADLIDPDRVLRTAAAIAYAELPDLYDGTGRLKPPQEWPPGLRVAVMSARTTRHHLMTGDGQQEDVVEVKLWDKIAAITLIMKHLGLIRERLDVQVDAELEAALVTARQRFAAQALPPATTPAPTPD